MTTVITRTGHVFGSMDEARGMSSPKSVALRVRRSHFFDPTPPVGVIKQRIEIALIVGWIIGGKTSSDAKDDPDAKDDLDIPVQTYYHRYDPERAAGNPPTDPKDKDSGLHFSSKGGLAWTKVDTDGSTVKVLEGYTFSHGGNTSYLKLDTASILQDGAPYIKSASIADLRAMLSGSSMTFAQRAATLSANPTAAYADTALANLASALEKRAGYLDAMDKVEQYPHIEHSTIDPVRAAGLKAADEASGGEGVVAVEQSRIEVLRDQIGAIEKRINSYLEKNFCVTVDWTLPFLFTHKDAMSILVEAISSGKDTSIPNSASAAEVDDYMFRRAGKFIGEAIERQFVTRVII